MGTNAGDEEQSPIHILSLHEVPVHGDSASSNNNSVEEELSTKYFYGKQLASKDSLENENDIPSNDIINSCNFQAPKEESPVTYFSLLKSNRSFRIYLVSYIITQFGEWFTYVAAIELIEQLLGRERASSRKYISVLIIIRLVPYFVLIPFGGVLADAKDRRRSMMTLDAIGAIVQLLYLFAAYFESITIIYMVTLLQSSLGALYEPCRASIIPLMAPEEDHMQKATTMIELTWSVMVSIGAASGGYMVGQIGVNACFIIDSATFLVSTLLLSTIGGTWCVPNETEGKMTNWWEQIEDMTVNCFIYIKNETFWPILFLKVTTCLIYGGADALNVSFAEEDPLSSQQEQSQKLGDLFFSVGVGCVLGPIIWEPFTSMSDPISLLDACIFAFVLQGVGWFFMGYLSPFSAIVFSSMVRAAGSSICWVDSQILLQMLVKPEMLGRVVAIDSGLALAAEALSAGIVGSLQDNFGCTARQSSMLYGILAAAFVVVWLWFRVFRSSALLPNLASANESPSSNDISTERTKLLTQQDLTEE